jgi:hypothetical protein
MYKSNNYRFKAYKSSRREEEKNAEDQQDGLDEILAEQRGEMDTSLKFARMAKRVINSFGEQVTEYSDKPSKATDFLGELINSGRLTNWFDQLKKADLKGLSPEAQDIVKDIKDPKTRKELTSAFNNQLGDLLAKRTKQEGVVERGKLIDQAQVSEFTQGKRIAPNIAQMAAEKATEYQKKRNLEAFDAIGSQAAPRKNPLLDELKTKIASRGESAPASLANSPKYKDKQAIKDLFIDTVGKGNAAAVEELVKKVSPTASEALTVDSSQFGSTDPPGSPAKTIDGSTFMIESLESNMEKIRAALTDDEYIAIVNNTKLTKSGERDKTALKTAIFKKLKEKGAVATMN